MLRSGSGAIITNLLLHPISKSSSMLALLAFNRENPVPIGGSQVTVQAASYGDNGIVNHGASWRFVIDTKDMSNGYHIVGRDNRDILEVIGIMIK